MNVVPVSLEVLATVLGTEPGSVSDALKADDNEWKPQADIDAYFKNTFNTKLKSVRKEGHDEGHGRATRETLTAKEKEIREKYGLKGNTLDELLEEMSSNKGEGKSDLDEESIKAHPFFQSTVQKFQDKIREKDQEVKTIQEGVRVKEMEGELRKLATSIVDNKENKFLIPEDPANPAVRQMQIDLYFEQLKKGKWKVDEGKLLALNDKGDDILKDDSYNPISSEAYAKSIAERMFPKAKGEQREAPGVHTKPNGSNGNGSAFNFPKFKDQAEAMAYIGKTTDPKELDALQEHIQALKAEGALN